MESFSAVTTRIDLFRNEHAFLSNFYESPIKFEGTTYPTVEHALGDEARARPGE